MKTCVKLNFPPIKLRAHRRGGSVAVWDIVRGCYIVLTPEEWVRQHMVHYLVEQLAIPTAQITLEHIAKVNGQMQRADIVVFDSLCQAHILVECKAPDVGLSQSTLDQAVRYNSVVGARYIILTNGLVHHIYRRSDSNGEYSAVAGFDQLKGSSK